MNLNVKLEKIEKSYGTTGVFSGFSACFSAPESYALRGRSGCGKTTLLRLLAGLETPDAGRLLWSRTPKCAMVFQEDRLCPQFCAEENVALCMEHGEMRREEIREELLSVLPEECLGKPAGQLSGGQKRRVSVVRAMCAPGAEVLLLDEPFTGLDEQIKRRMYEYVLRKKRDRLLLMATHDPEDISGLGIRETQVIAL